jgi:putative endonuclease
VITGLCGFVLIPSLYSQFNHLIQTQPIFDFHCVIRQGEAETFGFIRIKCITRQGKSMYYLYIVECNDGTLYTGITRNVKKRIRQHNAGKGAKYTRGRRPVKLIYSESHESRSSACQREHQIKQWPRIKKLDLSGRQ